MVRRRPPVFALVTIATLAWFVAGCQSEPPAKSKKAVAKGSTTAKSQPNAKPNAKPKAAPPANPEDNQTEVGEDPTKHPRFVLDMGDGLKMEFVWLPTGSFMMGDPKEGIPRHREKIANPFYMATCEVTQEQWEYLMKDNPSLNKGDAKRPVDRVNWDDCMKFLELMNSKYGKTAKMQFDLPTEAQWEWACKAGYSTRLGSSDDRDRLPEFAWYGGNSDRETHPVGTKKANDWGLCDMHGNVAEFCKDVASKEDAAKPDTHVVRGGMWKDGETACRSTARMARPGKVKLRFDGLRLVCRPMQ